MLAAAPVPSLPQQQDGSALNERLRAAVSAVLCKFEHSAAFLSAAEVSPPLPTRGTKGRPLSSTQQQPCCALWHASWQQGNDEEGADLEHVLTKTRDAAYRSVAEFQADFDAAVHRARACQPPRSQLAQWADELQRACRAELAQDPLLSAAAPAAAATTPLRLASDAQQHASSSSGAATAAAAPQGEPLFAPGKGLQVRCPTHVSLDSDTPSANGAPRPVNGAAAAALDKQQQQQQPGSASQHGTSAAAEESLLHGPPSDQSVPPRRADVAGAGAQRAAGPAPLHAAGGVKRARRGGAGRYGSGYGAPGDAEGEEEGEDEEEHGASGSLEEQDDEEEEAEEEGEWERPRSGHPRGQRQPQYGRSGRSLPHGAAPFGSPWQQQHPPAGAMSGGRPAGPWGASAPLPQPVGSSTLSW